VALRIAAAGHVEEDARPPLLPHAGMSELQAKLGLADARGPGHDGQRARHQPATQQFIETSDTGGKTNGHGRDESQVGPRIERAIIVEEKQGFQSRFSSSRRHRFFNSIRPGLFTFSP
jgi:hypothetical protein